MKNRRGKKINPIYFRKFQKKYVTMGLEWLPVFREGCISVVVKKNISIQLETANCALGQSVWYEITFNFYFSKLIVIRILFVGQVNVQPRY